MKAYWRAAGLWLAACAPVTAATLSISEHSTAEEVAQARMFEEALAPTGGEPTAEENAALAVALLNYTKRSVPDDFSSLTQFLQQHPNSPWTLALLTALGREYSKTAYYSLALDTWREAWALGQDATDIPGKFLADRAVCELAHLYSRLGRMHELEDLLNSVEPRMFVGGATERIGLAREALWLMQNQPGASFRCGPLALQSILRSDPSLPTSAATNAMVEILNSASTSQGFSLRQVAELSTTLGLNYQMARRESDGDFVLPSVVHWKAGHYAALVGKADDLYLLEDPTFGNSVWATRRALETEASGYFLIPPGNLPHGWRSVDVREGGAIWGKGVTSSNDPDNYTPDDLQTGHCGGTGMAVSSVHLMLANLQLRDTPVGYTPPVGPAVRFTVRYNHRDYLEQAAVLGTNALVSVFGPDWTHDWHARIRDNPNNRLADVKYLVGGGGARTFTGFDTNSQTFAPQRFDQTQLKRIGAGFDATYSMTFPDGSRKVFGLRGGLGADVYLTQIIDSAGNAITLNYDDASQRLVSVTDAIGQITAFSYEHPTHDGLITKVTDPFGRFSTFEYLDTIAGYVFSGTCGTHLKVESIRLPRLVQITDVLGLSSRVVYEEKTATYINYDPESNVWCTNHYAYTGDTVLALRTPYGDTTFRVGNGPAANLTMRFVETVYPDGSRDRVEFNQSEHLGISAFEPASAVPQGMATWNAFLHARNTYYWSRNACAMAYGDYSKARIYHWLHAGNLLTTAGILESFKEPLEHRVWYDYAGQPGAYGVGSSDKPAHAGRVLDDGATQLYTYAYNAFGHVTTAVDPAGRRFSYYYDSNGIDLVEIRQTRAGNSELLFQASYNSQHQPLMTVDAAGQITTYTYNERGQLLTETNPKNETIAYAYDPNGFLTAIDGPLPGTNDVMLAAYDEFGRTRSLTGVSGYTLLFDYDALDRLVRVTHPDSTFTQRTYDRLDLVHIRHRDGQATVLEYNNMRQLTKETDPLGRVTRFSWCGCGSVKNLIDPMGRTTRWLTDVQGRLVSKVYSDGSQISYAYEDSTSRLRQVIDERMQVTHYRYHRDGMLQFVAYANAAIPTAGASFDYDADYQRLASFSDDSGTTRYSYYPVTSPPTLGAGRLASVDGPHPNDTMTYIYDELGRRVTVAIDGAPSTTAYDALDRVIGETNALGDFRFAYHGASRRLASLMFPNNQTEERAYLGTFQDLLLQRITHRVGETPISEFLYDHDVTAGRISAWSQQIGAQTPDLLALAYDDANQLQSATVTQNGTLAGAYGYTYDLAGNRLSEQAGSRNDVATHNALNQIATRTGPGVARTCEWDAAGRLVAVRSESRRTEFRYDGYGRRIAIRHVLNGAEVSHRRFVWSGNDICEERDAGGAVVKRYFPEGVTIESGPITGTFYYTRDHLGSICEITDRNGNVRARYAFDPYGRRTKLEGDVDADFGFAGMFWSPEVDLWLTLYRAYDAELGRWLSRDPLENAEIIEGPNLYAYVANNPVNLTDPFGLMGGEIVEVLGEIVEAGGEIVEVSPRQLWFDYWLDKALDQRRRGLIGQREFHRRMNQLTGPESDDEYFRRLSRKNPRYRLPVRPPPPLRVTGSGGTFGVVVDMGMTVLTMANCDVAEGIFALMRVRRGELANKYENEMMKQIQQDLP